MHRNSVLAAALAASLTCSVASAADMPLKAAPIMPPAPHSWTGLYFSVGAGGMWGDTQWLFTDGFRLSPSPSFSTAIGSLGIGYQYQFGHIGLGGAGLVLGVEAAGTWSFGGFDQSVLCPLPIASCQTTVAGVFTAGGKLGLAWQSFMVYGTGGYAYARVNSGAYLNATGVRTTFTEQYHDGWYAGAGIDYLAYTSRPVDVILGLEYQHFEFGSGLHATPNPIMSRNIDLGADLVKAKLTLKINP